MGKKFITEASVRVEDDGATRNIKKINKAFGGLKKSMGGFRRFNAFKGLSGGLTSAARTICRGPTVRAREIGPKLIECEATYATLLEDAG